MLVPVRLQLLILFAILGPFTAQALSLQPGYGTNSFIKDAQEIASRLATETSGEHSFLEGKTTSCTNGLRNVITSDLAWFTQNYNALISVDADLDRLFPLGVNLFNQNKNATYIVSPKSKKESKKKKITLNDVVLSVAEQARKTSLRAPFISIKEAPSLSLSKRTVESFLIFFNRLMNSSLIMSPVTAEIALVSNTAVYDLVLRVSIITNNVTVPISISLLENPDLNVYWNEQSKWENLSKIRWNGVSLDGLTRFEESLEKNEMTPCFHNTGKTLPYDFTPSPLLDYSALLNSVPKNARDNETCARIDFNGIHGATDQNDRKLMLDLDVPGYKSIQFFPSFYLLRSSSKTSFAVLLCTTGKKYYFSRTKNCEMGAQLSQLGYMEPKPTLQMHTPLTFCYQPSPEYVGRYIYTTHPETDCLEKNVRNRGVIGFVREGYQRETRKPQEQK